MPSLERFDRDDLPPLADAIRAIPRGVSTMESSARAVVDLLWEELGDDCALVRLYKTHPYGQLPPDLQAFASALTGGAPDPAVRCLTLFATRGREPAWNDRAASEGHKAIPLPSAEFVERLPMVSGLITQLGLDVDDVITPEKGRILDLARRTYGVFHVEDARGSTLLPAQDFVERHEVRSALGFGGVLYSGDFFAVVLFARVHVTERVADIVRLLSLATRVALLPFGSRVFD